jgi:hypothetical protein
MQVRPSPARTRASRLYVIAALLAMVAQLAIVLAPLAEGRAGVGMGPHVESSSSHNPAHHTHDEATCVACQVRTMFGVTGHAIVPPAAAALHALPVALRADDAPVAERVAVIRPRAPPCVI